ncbi:MAG: sortase A [Candidatus Azotimanducaceae bacterium]|jgi:sortase A
MSGTYVPGTVGTALIGGHRDTHFGVLRTLKKGDRYLVQTRDGRWLAYEIESVEVVDIRKTPAREISDRIDEVILVTCYPFDAVLPGGPRRYVVRAQRVETGA